MNRLRLLTTSICVLPLLILAPRNASAEVLREPTYEALALLLAAGGTNSVDCDGTILLPRSLVIDRDTVLDAAGHKLVISGNGAVRVFEVSPGINFSIANLEVRDGLTNSGAGLYNNGGTVLCSNVLFRSNHARGTNGPTLSPITAHVDAEPAYGGAVYNSGSLVIVSCRLLENSARGGDGGTNLASGFYGGNGADALGGAVYSSDRIAITNCTLEANRTQGGDGSAGIENIAQPGGAAGAAVYCDGPSLSIETSLFSGNRADSGLGPGRNQAKRRFAYGGAVCNLTGEVSVVGCTIISNTVFGRAAGAGIYNDTGKLAVMRSALVGNNTISDRQTGVYQSEGWPGLGGGLYNGGAGRLEDCAVASNSTTGGDGESNTGTPSPMPGGKGMGGGVCNLGALDFVRCSIYGNVATGGKGSVYSGPGGTALGGGVFNGSKISFVNCTLTDNRVIGGARAEGSWYFDNTGGDAYGGGLFNTNTASGAVTNCTVARNESSGGAGYLNAAKPGIGWGGNIAQLGELGVLNSIIDSGVTNNIQGTLTDLGHNISSDSSFPLTGDGSVNQADPKLSALGDFGGPTFTMALLQGSAAIDAGATLGDVNTDQRGVSRPYGAGFDIGAFETDGGIHATPFTFAMLSSRGGLSSVTGSGPGNRTFRLSTSEDLINWTDVLCGVTSRDGTFSVQDMFSEGVSLRFYRLVSP